jgi:short subunit dehydrogenase-like uncharacterized protein
MIVGWVLVVGLLLQCFSAAIALNQERTGRTELPPSTRLLQASGMSRGMNSPRTVQEIFKAACAASTTSATPNLPEFVVNDEQGRRLIVPGGRPRVLSQIPVTAALLQVAVIVPLSLVVGVSGACYHVARAFVSFTWQTMRRALGGVAASKQTTTSEQPPAAPASITPRSRRKYDVVLLGASGTTGRLALRHLVQFYYLKDRNICWAMAGRSPSKLQQTLHEVALELGLTNEEAIKMEQSIDWLSVDTVAAGPPLAAVVAQTRVVATTVGPYVTYGSTVVEYCARYGTHYCDITGEVQWVEAQRNRHAATARQTGAKLIPFCGHDSVPWDLSVLLMQQALKQHLSAGGGSEEDGSLASATFYDVSQNEAPPGTFATLLTYAKGGGRALESVPSELQMLNRVQSDLPVFIAPLLSFPWQQPKTPRLYTIPYIMAPVNAEVVKWSYADRGDGVAQADAGPRTLIYREFQVMPNLATAVGTYLGYLLFGSFAVNPITLYLLERFITPKQGPKMEDMLNKYFLAVFGQGVSRSGKVKVNTVCYFDRDCGSLETSRMLVESAICLALEARNLLNDESTQGGFYTPSNGIGSVLLDRLLATDPAMSFSMSIVPSAVTE